MRDILLDSNASTLALINFRFFFFDLMFGVLTMTASFTAKFNKRHYCY